MEVPLCPRIEHRIKCRLPLATVSSSDRSPLKSKGVHTRTVLALRPIQTSNFSCTEPNVAVKYMKSSTYESIRIGSFVLGRLYRSIRLG